MPGRGGALPGHPASGRELAADRAARAPAARVHPRRHGQAADPVPSGHRRGAGKRRNACPQRGAPSLVEDRTDCDPGAILVTLPEVTTPEADRPPAARWETWLGHPPRAPLPPLRLILIWDNLAGHLSWSIVRWLFQHGVLPLYTPLSGSWLNMAESVQRILVRRALAGQHPQSAAEIIQWLSGWRTPSPAGIKPRLPSSGMADDASAAFGHASAASAGPTLNSPITS